MNGRRTCHNRRQRRDSGTVSVYFIMVTAAFVAFTSLLIDFSRVAAFRKQSELAAKAGVRSVLSSFDPDVYSKYGLFIRGGDPADELFRETVEGNGEIGDGEGLFRYLDAQWSGIGVTESRPLAEHGVFRRQTMEEMKYKAPINLTLELLARFRGIVPAVKDAASTVDVLERMRNAYDKREAALDGVLREQESAGISLPHAFGGLIPYPPVALSGVRTAGKAVDTADAALMYGDYVEKKREDTARDEARRLSEEDGNAPEESAGPIHSAAILAYEASMAKLTASLNAASTDFKEELDRRLDMASLKLEEAESYNAELSRLAEEASSLKGEYSGEDSGYDDPEAKLGADTISPLSDIRKSVTDLVLDGSFFSDYRSELEEQRSSGIAVSDSVYRVASAVAASIGTENDGQALKDEAANVQNDYNGFHLAYGSEGSIPDKRKKLLDGHRTGDNERRLQEDKANEARKSAAGWLGAIQSLQGSKEQRLGFEEAIKLYKANLEWNKTEEEHLERHSRDDASGERDEALEATEGWLNLLLSGVAEARDSIFFGEYVYERFSRFEPADLREALSGGNEGGSSLSLERMETEFILYGLTEPAANVAASYGELFAFRLAIRTMEGLIECRGFGHPLVILAAALAYGFSNALTDVVRLVEKGSVPLSKYAKADTAYGDYARFFLIAHGQPASAAARCIAVMERKLGLALTKAYTYVSGEGTASLKLWFFPGLLKLFGRSDSLGGTIRGNRYEVTFTADSSYQ
ncbi:hypothetical protein ACFPVX_11455 [Cohnella faecalis]|uniref:Uncharacterized protein n=1 Tax=Cohnella faecalis TaxID=2315694 RepID=A0A398CI92_9BACL|nr:hypothetical protein [Cohnella faecalis]RIE00899.1 hypothetical protein D3H35_25330 [Cohnella faecalis]